MNVKRVASVPMIVHDPYFSVWSGSDYLYDEDLKHWSGAKQRIRGYVLIDEIPYCFMGDHELYPVIPQTGIDITPLSTEYTFENELVQLKVTFTSPLLLTDFLLVSRPCTYIDVTVERKKAVTIAVEFQAFSDLVKSTEGEVIGGNYKIWDVHYAMMGKANQKPLGHSGDHVTMDWGYLYLASQDPNTVFSYDAEKEKLTATGTFLPDQTKTELVIAYDDILSINYFGQWRRAYWTKQYSTILEAIKASLEDKKEVMSLCAEFSENLLAKAGAIGGEDYVFLCSMSYRQSVAAHKLIEDEEGNLLFLSKENDSNGCIGTVDISYPSMPLFLLYDTEYIKGMLRPVFKFADYPVWEYDFAPHDVGRYPYAWGQVYGLEGEKKGKEFIGENGAVYPPLYLYPECGIYDLAYQMPVEECGNMLIMTAICCSEEESITFAAPYMEQLSKWTNYLLQYGSDPGEQLCTDDFAGHLEHNTNLAVKAIMGIKAFSVLLELNGQLEESREYRKKAEEMAASWEERAEADNHYMLAFGKPDSWSLKYNLIWDEFFGEPLFSKEVIQKELEFYCEKTEKYGVPLDSRKTYTKSDWILWCAAMAEKEEQRRKLISPIADYLRETSSRVPFSDWYDTVTGSYCHFIARSVQGGIFMPLFMNKR